MNNPESYEQQQSQLNRHKQPNHINANMYMPGQSGIIFQHPGSSNSGIIHNQIGATQIVQVSSQPHPFAFTAFPAQHPNFHQPQQVQFFNPAGPTGNPPVSIHQSQPHIALQSPIPFLNNQTGLVVPPGSLNQQEEGSGSGSSSLSLSQPSLPSLSSSQGGLISQQSPRLGSPLPSNREPPKIISWADLVSLLQNEPGDECQFASLTADAGVASRPYSGQLFNGQFFTPKSPRKDQYFLFASKSDYISHFVHYYFSTSNMRRDTTLQSLLIEGGCLPVERLLLFPKLSQIETSEEDLIVALENSPKVTIVSLHDGRRAVKRIDNWSPTQSAGPSTPGVYENVSTYTPVAGSNGIPNSGSSRMHLVQALPPSSGQVPHANQFQQGALYTWMPHGGGGYFIPHPPTTTADTPHAVHQQLAHFSVPHGGSFLQQGHYPQHIVMGPPTVVHHHQGSGSGAVFHPQTLSEQQQNSMSTGQYHSGSASISSQPPPHNWVQNH